MKLVFMILAVFILGPATNAAAKTEVDLADVAELNANQLETLRDPHHQLALARIFEAGAKRLVTQANEEVKQAKRDAEAKEADSKAAKAELDAAKKNNDPSRIRSAEDLVRETAARLKTAKALTDWKGQMENVRKAELELSKKTVETRSAELQLAQAELVISAGTKGSKQYRIADFRREVSKTSKDLEKVLQKADQERDKGRQAEARWAKESQESR